jgi:ubiquitin C-terminal hydrolase
MSHGTKAFVGRIPGQPVRVGMLNFGPGYGHVLTLEPRNGKPRLELTWSEFAAFLLQLGPEYQADDVTAKGRSGGWTHVSAIYCKRCIQELIPRNSKPNADQMAEYKRRVKPDYLVYIRKAQSARPGAEFLIVFQKSCRHHHPNLWDPPVRGDGGMHDCRLDLSLGVHRMNTEPVIRDCPLLYPFGVFMKDEKLIDVTEMDWFNRSALPPTTAWRLRREETATESLDSLMHALHGYKVIRLAPGDATSKLSYPDDHGQERDLVSATWITQWARQAWKQADYIQLDCSFYVTRPFVYCVPQAIIANEAIPLGFIIAPSESFDTYEWILADLQNADVTEPLPPQKILSDEHAGLKEVCRKLEEEGWLQFFCHRHLIEKFGAFGYIASLVRQVLACRRKEDYERIERQIRRNARYFFRTHTVKPEYRKMFWEFLADPAHFAHGQWLRAPLGIGRCDQHAERFHGVAKQTVKKRQVTLLSARMGVLVSCIADRYDAYQRQERRQLMETVRDLIKQNASTEPAVECSDPECLAFQQQMCRRFHTKTFPCRHTAAWWHAHHLGDIEALPVVKSDDYDSVPVILNQPKRSVQVTGKAFRKYHLSPEETEDWGGNSRDEVEQRDIHDIPEYGEARQIVVTVKLVADQRGKPADVVIDSHWILEDWKVRFPRMLAQQEPSEPHKEKWIARYTQFWSVWAEQGNLSHAPDMALFSDRDPGDEEEEVPEAFEADVRARLQEQGRKENEAQGVHTIGSPHCPPVAAQPPRPPCATWTSRFPGIPNFSRHDCYFIAAFQTLVHLDSLHSYFAAASSENVEGKPAAAIFWELQHALDGGAVSEELVQRATSLGKGLVHARYGADAVEFLVHILSLLHGDLGTARRDWSFAENDDEEGLPSLDEWTRVIGDKVSIIHDQFMAQVCCRRECSACQFASGALFRSSYFLQLPWPERWGPGLQLGDFFAWAAEFALSDLGVNPRCPRCQREAAATLQFHRLAPVLILELVRQTCRETQPGLFDPAKATAHVGFPDRLELTEGCSNAQMVYDLHSVIVHDGDFGRVSHYTAYIRVGGVWHLFNDANVSVVPADVVLGAMASVLMYVRVAPAGV